MDRRNFLKALTTSVVGAYVANKSIKDLVFELEYIGQQAKVISKKAFTNPVYVMLGDTVTVTFDEIKDVFHVLKSGRITHAYILENPDGSKTVALGDEDEITIKH